MARARICVELPDGRWKSDVTREFPEIQFRLPSVTMSDGRAVEVVVADGNVVETCLSALEEHSDVADSIIFHREKDKGIIQIQTTDPLLQIASRQSRTPLMYPIEIYQGNVIVDVIAPYDNISALGTQLKASGATFNVEYVQRDHEMCRVLTERQREVLLAAVEHGYYETPRRCSLTELADKMGIAKSTCSGMLQRIEKALVDDFLVERSATSPHSKNKQAQREIENPNHSSGYL